MIQISRKTFILFYIPIMIVHVGNIDSFADELTAEYVDVRTLPTKKTLCPEGQYVYKCGNYRIGFNWLKGMNKIVTASPDNDNKCPDGYTLTDNICTKQITTSNYYISDDTEELFDQMRKFFAGELMEYCNKWDDETNSCTAKASKNSLSDRNIILNNLCDRLNSNVTITCAQCPDAAKIGASIYDLKAALLSTLVSNKNPWVFHTIADCYIKDFTDSTGTYKYVDNNDTSQTAKACYYVNTNPYALSSLQGDSIDNVTDNDGLSTTLEVHLPISLKKDFN